MELIWPFYYMKVGMGRYLQYLGTYLYLLYRYLGEILVPFSGAGQIRWGSIGEVSPDVCRIQLPNEQKEAPESGPGPLCGVQRTNQGYLPTYHNLNRVPVPTSTTYHGTVPTVPGTYGMIVGRYHGHIIGGKTAGLARTGWSCSRRGGATKWRCFYFIFILFWYHRYLGRYGTVP